ncbi:MAG: hypothetical protein HY731_15530, partial [Candidatus Tectomicrobia bacterium]|nr:hypothetical protein [Candidatus Tectomicrobia bacterium]
MVSKFLNEGIKSGLISFSLNKGAIMEEEKEPLGDRTISKKQQAFEELTREHLASLYTIAVRLSRDKTVAEDLVQETYLKAYKSFEQFRIGSHCKAWLMKILTNVY